jgi:cyclase
MMSDQELPKSKHFRLQQLAEGVYAAIHINGGGAFGNAGIVDLGNRTLIFDSFFTPQAAEALRIAAETLTGRPIEAVINSHFHNDHIWGNQVFSASTEIISTEVTRRLFIATKGLGGYDNSFMINAETDLESTFIQFQTTQDEDERRQLALWVDSWQSVVAAKPILQTRAPNLTFSNHLEFHGTKRSAKLIEFEGGHTDSDTILFLPDEKIVFMGDLLCIDHHPWLIEGNPDRFHRALEAVSDFAPKQLVPGHGPVGAAESLIMMMQYIHTLERITRKMVDDGEAEETIDEMVIPDPFSDWLFASFFSDNLHFLYQHQLRKQKDEVA